MRYLDLTDGQVEKGVAFSDFDDGFRTDTSHTGSETTIEFEDDEFVEESGAFGFLYVIIVDDLFGIWRVNSIPITAILAKLAAKLGSLFTFHFPLPCHWGIVGREQRNCPFQFWISRQMLASKSERGISYLLRFRRSGFYEFLQFIAHCVCGEIEGSVVIIQSRPTLWMSSLETKMRMFHFCDHWMRMSLSFGCHY